MDKYSPLIPLFLALIYLMPAEAKAQIDLPIVNAGFETGAPMSIPTGWTVASGSNPYWIGNSLVGAANPSTGYNSTNFVSASWEIAGLANANSLIGSAANSALIFQDIDLTPHSSLISQGDRFLGYSYAYFINDGNDFGSIDYDFYDAGDSLVGNFSIEAQSAPGGWQFIEDLGGPQVPSNAKRLRISIGAGLNPGAFGSARNVAFDTITASLQPPPAPETFRDRVNGNLIEFNNDGTWSWYMDERMTQDTTQGNYLISSITSSNSTNLPGGTVRTTSYDPATGMRVTRVMADLDEDDHNAGGILVLPDGRYLTLYSNHGHQGLQDTLSRYRVTTNPHDASNWEPEQAFDWRTTPGWNQNPFSSTGVSYHNVYYLPAEDRVINFSRGTHMAMGALEFDPDTDSLTWLGQTQQSITTNYGQGYYKYASNGDDKIYFIATETHPYDVNTSIFSGYYSNGQTFRMDGTVMDDNSFDSEESAPGATVPYTEEFTLVQQSNVVGEGYNNLWTADLAAHPGGTVGGLYTSKFEANDFDQRLHYAYWDGSQWHTNEVAKMGAFLFDGQEEYTGVGAVVPDQPGVIYISTPIDPRTDVDTGKYEIYKGVTANQGADWDWTAVTEDSSVDNLRPIATSGKNGETVVSWFRGTYNAIWDVDAAIVGIIDNPGQQRGLTNYVDANAANTTRDNGSAIGATSPGGSAGADDDLWHERTGIGNGGSVYTSNESGGENAPALKTTIAGLDNGLYDVFAYFWSDNDEDWRLAASLEQGDLVDFRKVGAQSAELSEFVSIEVVSAIANDLQLYRAYVGRTTVENGSNIEVFIDDWAFANNSSFRAWYDGVGYALVSPLLRGDYNGDGTVDAADYTVWRNNLGATGLPAYELADGDGDGEITQLDYDVWRMNYGASVAGLESQSANEAVGVPEPASLALAVFAAILWFWLPQRR